MIVKVFFFLILLISNALAGVTQDLIKLSEMYKDGLLTQEEFSKAKSILLQIEEIETSEKKEKIKPKESDKKKKQKKVVKKTPKNKEFYKKIKIERIFTTEGSKFTTKSFEKMKLDIGDFTILTHRPGAIKIKKISNNKQLAVIGDKLKIKYYNNGQDFLNINVNKQNKELTLRINNTKVLVWKGQYVEKAEATFYQILAMGRLPFHFYVNLDKANNAVALNMEKFNRRIELAVDEVKIKLANQYNLSVDQIDNIIETNDMMAVYGEKIPTNLSVDTSELEKNKLYAELKESLGEENYLVLSSNINTSLKDDLDNTVNKEIQLAIDDSIRDAINSGIETAALEAGLTALIEALLSGASWADALKAGEQACAGSGGC